MEPKEKYQEKIIIKNDKKIEPLEGNIPTEILTSCICDEQIILNTHTDSFFSDIYPWLTRDDHTSLKYIISLSCIVNIESKKVRSRVRIVLTGELFSGYWAHRC